MDEGPTGLELEERRLRAHDALLDRFLGYVVGALAGFLPLLEFAITSDTNGRLALPSPLSLLLVLVGSLVTVLLTGAALVSFRQAIGLERELGIEPAQVSPGLVSGSFVVAGVHRLYARGLAGSGRVGNAFVDVVFLVVATLTVWIDLTLPWPRISSPATFWPWQSLKGPVGGLDVDLASGVAIALGALAVLIAVWDHIRDRYYWTRAAGPLDVQIVAFDLPDPSVRIHQYLAGGQSRQFTGPEVRIVFKFWNRVSWPVYFGAALNVSTLSSGLKGTAIQHWVFRDELLQETGGNLMVPPRQPISRTAWIVLGDQQDVAVTPSWTIAGRTFISQKGKTMKLRWVDGEPTLSE